MIDISYKKEQCCGCSACYSICPKNAISMVEDEKGFKYPKVDKTLCIQCGLCDKACAFSKEQQFYFNAQPLAAYAVKHKDEGIRKSSRSGGVFTAVTDYVLQKGGCIYGAAIDVDFTVKHIKAENAEQRDRMRGSKYVQSDMNDIYRDVKKELATGRLVVFSGTGCQVAGLRSFLMRDYENLIAIDLICHGVPSPKVWKDYIKLLQKKFHNRISEVQFRDKEFLGWDLHLESFKIGNNKIYERGYTNLFYSNHILRDSCFNCKYTNMCRTGDFTLADFWGIDKMIQGFNDNKGVSLFFVNSRKGEEIFRESSIRDCIHFVECPSFDFVHPNLKHAEPRPKDIDAFWEDYIRNGIKKVLNKYGGNSFVNKMKRMKLYTIIFVKRKIIYKRR